jgi:hypothetical protein
VDGDAIEEHGAGFVGSRAEQAMIAGPDSGTGSDARGGA